MRSTVAHRPEVEAAELVAHGAHVAFHPNFKLHGVFKEKKQIA